MLRKTKKKSKAKAKAFLKVEDLDDLEEDNELYMQLSKSSKSKKSSCKCECDYSKISFLESALGSNGYGKYCGAGYTCSSGDAGCDPVDSCCKTHDACVGKSGYCDSCDCNNALVSCLRAIPKNATLGFSGCNDGSKARADILSDVCTVIEHAPSICGGCKSSKDHPSACKGSYGSSSTNVVSPVSLLLGLILASVLPFFLSKAH